MPRNELFLGGLSRDTRRRDLEDIFERYGKLTRCDIKYVNGYAGTAFGFVAFDDERDAETDRSSYRKQRSRTRSRSQERTRSRSRSGSRSRSRRHRDRRERSRNRKRSHSKDKPEYRTRSRDRRSISKSFSANQDAVSKDLVTKTDANDIEDHENNNIVHTEPEDKNLNYELTRSRSNSH